MKAYIDATGYRSEMSTLLEKNCTTPLLSVVDKPIIIHIIEFLKKIGVTHFEIYLYHQPYMIESTLGEGERWGITLNYHLVTGNKNPFSSLRIRMENKTDEKVILASAETLPLFDLDFLKEKNQSSIVLVDSEKKWTGWAIASLQDLIALNEISEASLVTHFPSVEVNTLLSVRGYKNWQQSNFRALQNSKNISFPSTARQDPALVWISHGSNIHPSVKIEAPVFIGENCHIKSHCKIGPNVVIENECIIDKNSSFKQSLICQRSYVGEGLEIDNSIVDNNLLINLTFVSEVYVTNHFILSRMDNIQPSQFAFHVLERIVAISLLVMLYPILLFLALKYPIAKKQVLVLPTESNKILWKTIGWTYSPRATSGGFISLVMQLINVAQGKGYFVGVPPRSIEEVESLSADWQNIYLKSKIGIMTITDVEHEKGEVDADQLYADETFYAMQSSPTYDLKLLYKWLKKEIKAIFKI